MDAATGTVLLSRRMDERSLIASTTKIMTGLLICEQYNVLERVKIPKAAVGIEGSSMYLQEGEILTLQELLYGLMLSSGNDAAVALALYGAGSVEGFAQKMNDKAKVLGLSHTHFENPNGLDSPNHYSTAHDLAKLAAYAMDNPVFARTVSTKTVRVGERMLRNHNKLLWRFTGTDGVKTGYTRAAGRILVSSAVRDGRRLIAVTIDDPDDWTDHETMLERAFSQYTMKTIVRRGQTIGQISVAGGVGQSVDLVAGEDFSLSLAKEELPGFLRAGRSFAYAPVVRGADAGFVYVVLGGKAVGRIPVTYGATVEQTPEKKRYFWQ